jgi:galactokinase
VDRRLSLFVPGRVCLFGEHTDWAGGHRRANPDLEKGYTLICGTDQGIYALVERHASLLVLTATSPEGEAHGPYAIPMRPEALLTEARVGGFWSYIAGTAYQVLSRFPVGGLVIDNYLTDLPIQKGLSSSAAICVLTARAFGQLYDLELSTRDEMELAYQGEITTPSRCGRMDQGCAFGPRPVLMTYDADDLAVEELAVSQDIYLVLVNLHAHKDTRRILAALNRCFPLAEDDVARGVQKLLGPINRQIVTQAVRALSEGDALTLGALMTEAQAHFDQYATPACPEELAAPVLHRLLCYQPLQPLVWGGKGVGSQGDGAAQFIARGPDAQRAAVDLIERELGMTCLSLTIRASSRLRNSMKA